MRTIFVFFAIFCLGVLLGSTGWLPDLSRIAAGEQTLITVLLLIIGVGVGMDEDALGQFRKLNWQTLLFPLLVAVGSMLGAGLVTLLLPQMGFLEGMAVGSGFGFYSLSSIILTELHGPQLGSIALLSNLLRELATLLLAPLMVRFFGRTAPVASAGATAMDVCLPVIQRFAGNRYAVLAIISGVVLSVLVPLLVPLFV